MTLRSKPLVSAGCAAALALLAAASAQAALPAGYHLVDLGEGVQPLGGDEAGDIAGSRTPAGDTRATPVVISDGRERVLDSGGFGGNAHGVTGDVVVGSVYTARVGPQSPVLWAADGTRTTLATDASWTSTLALARMPDGTVYGTGGTSALSHCVRWTGAGPGQPGVVQAFASGCTVVGASPSGKLALQTRFGAALWSDGVTTRAGFLRGGTQSFATGVNALGHLSAYGDAAQDKVDRPAFFDGQRLLALPGLGGKRGRAEAINDLDEVAGVADDAEHHSHPFLHTGGQTFAIDGLVDDLGDFHIQDIVRLGNDGVILADALIGLRLHGVLLVPTTGAASVSR